MHAHAQGMRLRISAESRSQHKRTGCASRRRRRAARDHEEQREPMRECMAAAVCVRHTDSGLVPTVGTMD